MKPLTIEELKALEVGDWVWIIYHKQYEDEKFYAQLSNGYTHFEHNARGVELGFDTYDKTWVAYKNKEQAEAKGEIVELPIRSYKDVIYYDENFKRFSKNGIVVERYTYEQDAERRLVELKGE